MTTTASPERVTAHPTARPEAPSAAPSWATLPVLLTGIFITTLDFFIVNVAIPSTQGDLHASPSAIQFISPGSGWRWPRA
jgi:hypothetical protein